MGSLWVSVKELWGKKGEKLGVAELEISGQRIGYVIVFPWNVFRVESGIMAKEETG